MYDHYLHSYLTPLCIIVVITRCTLLHKYFLHLKQQYLSVVCTYANPIQWINSSPIDIEILAIYQMIWSSNLIDNRWIHDFNSFFSRFPSIFLTFHRLFIYCDHEINNNPIDRNLEIDNRWLWSIGLDLHPYVLYVCFLHWKRSRSNKYFI